MKRVLKQALATGLSGLPAGVRCRCSAHTQAVLTLGGHGVFPPSATSEQGTVTGREQASLLLSQEQGAWGSERPSDPSEVVQQSRGGVQGQRPHTPCCLPRAAILWEWVRLVPPSTGGAQCRPAHQAGQAERGEREDKHTDIG